MIWFRSLVLVALMPLPIATADATGGSSMPVSKECLSCHDGTNAPGMRLEVSHPFAVEYAAPRQRDLHLRPATDPSGLGSTIDADMLVDGRVECSSCHVPHEKSAEYKFRLRTGNPTQLCVICHESK